MAACHWNFGSSVLASGCSLSSHGAGSSGVLSAAGRLVGRGVLGFAGVFRKRCEGILSVIEKGEGYMGVFKNRGTGVPQNGWFIMENPIRMG